jgi:hypothetical protein
MRYPNELRREEKMNFIIFFDSKDYFVAPLAAGSHSETIMIEAHPGCIILDNAISQEDASIKIQRDRDRSRPIWM